jgi:Regulator of chromosome condensation (RCC1) repeat
MQGGAAGAGDSGAALGGTAGLSNDQVAGASGTGDAGGGAQLAPSHLALGAEYGCVIDSAGSIVCWGMPSLDVGQTNSPSGAFLGISAAPQGELTCAIDSSGKPVCWGNVVAGAAVPTPTAVDAVGIDVGVAEQCVLNRDGSVSCWGVGLPQAPSGPFRQVGVGNGFACALRLDGTIVCWGSSSKATNPPAGTYVEVQTGAGHSCARTQDGSVSCWGLGDLAAVNDGTQNAWGQAIAPQGVQFKSLALGVITSCGILDSGDVQCWGAGKIAGDCSTPNTCGQALPQTGPFTEIAVGYTHACGLLATGKIKCWGSNTGGRGTPPSQFQ